jgi:hypothetical protein
MSDKHFLFTALDIEQPDLTGPAMKVVNPGKQHLLRRKLQQQLASISQRMQNSLKTGQKPHTVVSQ